MHGYYPLCHLLGLENHHCQGHRRWAETATWPGEAAGDETDGRHPLAIPMSPWLWSSGRLHPGRSSLAQAEGCVARQLCRLKTLAPPPHPRRWRTKRHLFEQQCRPVSQPQLPSCYFCLTCMQTRSQGEPPATGELKSGISDYLCSSGEENMCLCCCHDITELFWFLFLS